MSSKLKKEKKEDEKEKKKRSSAQVPKIASEDQEKQKRVAFFP